MGANSSSEAHFFRPEDFVNDPTAFRVFTKKRNKFIPGWLKINDEEIIFTRGGASSFQFWPLAYLRRYGYTCSGVFFFESGRRCATGEGLHTFQSHQAERIFQVVQSRIRIEEYARGSRASSVASSRQNNVNPPGRIHPVQRFSSEGQCDGGRAFPGGRHPSSSSAHSAIVGSVGGNGRAERPRSVVSAVDHVVHGTAGDSLLQFHPSHRHYPPSPASMMSGSCIQPNQLMARSFNSTSTSLNAACAPSDSGVSPWTSQSMLLEGEIAAEHVLSPNPSSQRPAGLPRPSQSKYHSYVNVELAGPPLPVRELHRTLRTPREEFLTPRAPSSSSIVTASTLAGSPLPPTPQSAIPVSVQMQASRQGTAFRPLYNARDPSRHLRLPQPPPPSAMSNSVFGSFPSQGRNCEPNGPMSNSMILPSESGFNSRANGSLTKALGMQETRAKARVNYALIDLERTATKAPADPEPPKDGNQSGGSSSKGSFLPFRRKANRKS